MHETLMGSVGRSPEFRRFIVSRTVSLAGDAMVPTALALSVVERGSSPDWLGGVLAAAVLPKVLFFAVGGVAADRFVKRNLMIGSSMVCAAAQVAERLRSTYFLPPTMRGFYESIPGSASILRAAGRCRR